MSDVSPSLQIARTVERLRATVRDWRRQGLTVAFVPTMGALHEGHLALVREGGQRADRVVASVFVNPAQFAAHEDLGTYPRREAEDATLLAEAGCDLLFAPGVTEMYPDGFVTSVRVGGPSQGLETDFRPHFFAGVAVVVTKLLNQVQADMAVFGEKDWQQLMVVRRMVRDLDIPTEIVGVSTKRDARGLALSSRNAYLSVEELEIARKLNVVLASAAAQAADGKPVAAVQDEAADQLLEAGFTRVDYVAVRQEASLAHFVNGTVDAPARVLAAAWIGATRLIDNMSAGNP